MAAHNTQAWAAPSVSRPGQVGMRKPARRGRSTYRASGPQWWARRAYQPPRRDPQFLITTLGHDHVQFGTFCRTTIRDEPAGPSSWVSWAPCGEVSWTYLRSCPLGVLPAATPPAY